MPLVWQKFRSLLMAAIILGCVSAEAQDAIVFDVRKNLPMSSDEPIYRDFYINAGTSAGIKRGMIITVMRKRALYDPYQNNNPSDLNVPVGQLKVIHAQKDISVARLYKTFDRHDKPILEFNFILVGDRLDLATATFEKSGGKKSAKKTASAPQPIMVPKKPAEVKPLESQDFASSAAAPGDEQAPLDMPVQN